MENNTVPISPDLTAQSTTGIPNPSKGVRCYAYSGDASLHMSMSTKGKEIGVSNSPFTIISDSFQVDFMSNGLHGEVSWRCTQYTDDGVVGKDTVTINTMDGSISHSNMTDMLGTGSIITENCSVCYGFYDAGPGVGGLPDHHQLYAYATLNQANWMDTLAKTCPDMKSQPFSYFVLPGAHDAGMFTMDSVIEFINDSTFRNGLTDWLKLTSPLDGIVRLGLLSSATNILHILKNTAITQRDNIVTQLNLGIRLLDFRPGRCMDQNEFGTLYHMHGAIPGYRYDLFLADCLSWLLAHPTEIVVVNIQSSGVEPDFQAASADALDRHFAAAMSSIPAGRLVKGNHNDLGLSYDQLIAANKRIIFLTHDTDTPDGASRADSYHDDPYKTTDVNSIVGALNSFVGELNDSTNDKRSKDYTVFQLQGTASYTAGGVATTIASFDTNATSPLLGTKAEFDYVTYPWLEKNIPNAFNYTADKLIVCQNDFADNALVEICAKLTARRMEQAAARAHAGKPA